jgi:hypothetical protein
MVRLVEPNLDEISFTKYRSASRSCGRHWFGCGLQIALLDETWMLPG